MARGAVKKINHKGIELFCFPEIDIGKTEALEAKQEASRSTEMPQEGWDSFSKVIEDFAWGLALGNMADSATGSLAIADGQAAPAPKPEESTKLSNKLQEELGEADKKYNKMLKTVETVVSDAEGCLGKKGFTEAAEEQLQKTEILLPQAAAVGVKLHFMARHHRTTDGEALNVGVAKTTIAECTTMMANMYTYAVALRSMTRAAS